MLLEEKNISQNLEIVKIIKIKQTPRELFEKIVFQMGLLFSVGSIFLAITEDDKKFDIKKNGNKEISSSDSKKTQ